jgi:hypothetical protein
MTSTHSSAEGTLTSKYGRVINPTVTPDLQSKYSVERSLELGDFENVVPTRSFQRSEMENLKVDGVDPVFEAKAVIVNSAFQQIGMGKYQWKLFLLCGFGWVPLPKRRR